MIPLRCDTEQKRLPPATTAIVLLCGAVYALETRLRLGAAGFIPLDFTHSLFHPGLATLISAERLTAAFFMHAGLLHLVSNMWFLWIFGAAVEYALGFGHFTLLYLLCGAVSMLSQALSSPLSPTPIVGASGAIAGVMGLYFVLLPFSRIFTWIPPIFIVRVPAFVFLPAWFYVQYAQASAGGRGPVALWAHIGGFIAGAAWGIVFRIGMQRAANGAKRKRLRP